MSVVEELFTGIKKRVKAEGKAEGKAKLKSLDNCQNKLYLWLFYTSIIFCHDFISVNYYIIYTNQ